MGERDNEIIDYFVYRKLSLPHFEAAAAVEEDEEEQPDDFRRSCAIVNEAPVDTNA